MTDSTTIKALQYARVSTVRQRDDETIQSQLQAIAGFRTAHPEITVTQEFSDDGFTGTTTDNRQGYRMMLDALAKPDIKALIVYDLDRLGRELGDGIDLALQCRRLGRSIISVRDGKTYDLRDNDDLMRTVIKNWASAMEAGKVHDRIMAGLARARAAGKPLGRPPVDIDWEKFDGLLASGHSIASASRAMGLKPRTVYKRLHERSQYHDRPEQS